MKTGMILLLLGCMLMLPGSVALAQGVQPLKAAPAGAAVVKAFDKTQAACNAKTAWTVNADPKAWVDVGIEWGAKDTATAQDNLKHLALAIAVDGKPIGDLSSYQTAPEPLKLVCPSFTAEGTQIPTKIYVQLPPGDHKVTWKISYEADVNDGFSVTPAGTVMESTATVHVGPASLPVTGGNWLLALAMAGALLLLLGLGLQRRRASSRS